MPATLSLSDHGVAGLLAEGPAHGFALAQAYAREGELGLVWTIQRQQVYRALDHLERVGWIEPLRKEVGQGGPARVVYALTPQGEGAVATWLVTPVERLRDVRHALLLKVALLERRGLDVAPLVEAQRRRAEGMVAACESRLPDAVGSERLVLAWRLESGRALLAWLAAWG